MPLAYFIRIKKHQPGIWKNCIVCINFILFFGNVIVLFRWLIEVNASPSLTASSQDDYFLKFGLLEDMLHIIDMENKFGIWKQILTQMIFLLPRPHPPSNAYGWTIKKNFFK